MSQTLTTIDLHTSYEPVWKASYLKIYYNTAEEWLYTEWIGSQTPESIRNGCEQLLQLVKEKHCNKLINDLTNSSNMWHESVEWVSKDFAPRLYEAGVNYIAWIYAENSLSGLSADEALKIVTTEMISIVFDKQEMAETWLRSV